MEYYKVREIKTAAKKRRAINKTRRNKKKHKGESKHQTKEFLVEDSKKNNNDFDAQDSIGIVKNDSVLSLYFNRDIGFDTLIVLKTFSSDDSILTSDKEFLLSFFKRKSKNKNRYNIIIQEIVEEDYKIASLKTKELKEYLLLLNINATIYIKRNIRSKDKGTQNKIEIRIK